MRFEDVALPVAVEMIELGVNAIRTRPPAKDIAIGLVEIAKKLVPVEELRLYLTPTAKAHAEIITDLAEDAKFGSDDE